jgi:hypothetical protein
VGKGAKGCAPHIGGAQGGVIRRQLQNPDITECLKCLPRPKLIVGVCPPVWEADAAQERRLAVPVEDLHGISRERET